jgi:hypothetical protein
MDLATSLSGGPHALLRDLVGRWRGTARLWLEPEVLTSEDAVEGRRAGPRRAARPPQLRLSIDGEQHTGTALIGCTLSPAKWQVAWADTFHTGMDIMLSEGSATAPTSAVDVLGSYGAPEGPPWGWRTTLARQDERLRVRHFNITPKARKRWAWTLTNCQNAARTPLAPQAFGSRTLQYQSWRFAGRRSGWAEFPQLSPCPRKTP